MTDARRFLECFRGRGGKQVFGVPDSLMLGLSRALEGDFTARDHIVAVNEGAAVALAMGSYLASGSIPMVYMQNSGLGNALNPLTSLIDPLVCAVPMILVIGWRAEEMEGGGVLPDEPQHCKQGAITTGILDLLGIPFMVIDARSSVEFAMRFAMDSARERSGPTALLVRKGTFDAADRLRQATAPLPTRESAIKAIAGCLPADIPVVATTGMTSRELFEFRASRDHDDAVDFLTVGGMGHASSIAQGIALTREELKVVCLDGDGALLMHMGSLAMGARLSNFVHVVLNNGVHDSVGGQPTLAQGLRIADIASGVGYSHISTSASLASITETISIMLSSVGSCFLEVICSPGTRIDIGRPSTTPLENRLEFMARHRRPDERFR
jgi:phosphonopyruvate decarboxylase